MSIEEIILKVAAIPDASVKKLEAISSEVDYPKGHLLFDADKINSNIILSPKVSCGPIFIMNITR